MFLVIAIVTSLVAWCTRGATLARRIARRLCGGDSWQLGLPLGQAALPVALMDRTHRAPPQPQVLRRAQQGSGSLDVVVIVDEGDSEPSELDRPAVLQPGADVGRRAIVRIVPKGVPHHDVDEAGRQLCRFADAAGSPVPEVAVLFGTADAAVRRFAIGENYDMVVPLGNRTPPAVSRKRSASQTPTST